MLVFKKFEWRNLFGLSCFEVVFSDDEYNSFYLDGIYCVVLENEFECSILYFIIFVGSYKDNDFCLILMEK